MQMQRPVRLTLHYNELHNREYQRFSLLMFDTNFFTFVISPSRRLFYVLHFILFLRLTSQTMLEL